MGEVMNIKTKNFGEITIADEKIIEFPSGIIGFPELTQFALIHDAVSTGCSPYRNQILQCRLWIPFL